MRSRHRQYEADKRDFVQQVAATARATRAEKQDYSAWTGTRDLRISAIVDEALGVKSFYLTDPAGDALPEFEPGQYLTCHFATSPGEKPLVRCYSLSDRPREEYYRLTVKRCGPSADDPTAPDGRGSSRLHAMQVGDSLSVSAPRGGFFLDPRRKQPMVLIAGGIGVTPLASMLSALAAAHDPREVYLFHGVRNSQEHPLRDQLQEIADEHSNIRQLVAYSRPLAGDRLSHDFHHQGRWNSDAIRSLLPTGSYDYYLCGPSGMMESMIGEFLLDGVPEERIFYEAFGPASLPRAVDPAEEKLVSAGPSPTVRLANSHQQVDWDDHCRSLLELIEELGVAIDSGCRSGNCGMCAARVLEGDFATLKHPGATPPDGHCLACISVPKSPLVLEL